MTNAEIIATTLDGLLDHEVTLVVYGRAALALGYENVPEAIGRSLDAGAITTTQVPDVLHEWREPSHTEFLPRTAWSLFNAVTEVHKTVNPHTACRRGEALYGLFDAEAGVHHRN